MSSRSEQLPSFDRPPVVEVVLSVQFEPLVSLHTPQLGLLWKEFEARFPKTEDQPPLPPSIEQFGRRSMPPVSFSIQEIDGATPPRVWFLNREETELIQVQQDRFIVNWRQR